MVSLAKGQTISLKKTTGEGLTRVRMGLGWDVKKKGLFGMGGGGEIDLDASCVLFAGDQVQDTVWFRQLRSKDGAVLHSGDNRTGAGEGDDESIQVDLSLLPPSVTSLVFTVNSFTGETFDRVKNCFCRLIDETTGTEVARYDLGASGPHTAQVMAKLFRGSGGWEMKALGEPGRGRTFDDLLPLIRPLL